MNRSGLVAMLMVVLIGCDPTVTIGDPDAGVDAGLLGGGAGGGTGGGGGVSSGPGPEPVCQRWRTASSTFFAGQSSCVGTSNTISSDPDATNTCLSNIAQCSTADLATLGTYLSCLEQLPACTAGNENTAVNGFMNCVSTAFSTLSDSCKTALVRLRPAGKRVFITRQLFNGALGGLAGADSKCSTAATAAGLNGTWKAWLSTTTVNAMSRLTDVGPWLDLMGTTAFASKSALTMGGPSGGLWYDERGMFLSSDRIWTGTGSQGTYQSEGARPPCEEWTSASMQSTAHIGQVGRAGPEWTSFSGTTCDQNAHLLCFEQ